MLFTNHLVDLPAGTNYKIKKVKGTDLCYYIETITEGKRQGRTKSKLLGEVTTDESGTQKLIPNENYFIHMKLNFPKDSLKKVSLKKQLELVLNVANPQPNYIHIPASLGTFEPLPTDVEELKALAHQISLEKQARKAKEKGTPNLTGSFSDGKIANGYMIAIFHEAQELGLYNILEPHYLSKTKSMIVVAGYFAKNDPSGIYGLEYFTQKNNCYIDHPMTVEKLNNLYTYVSDRTRFEFYPEWIAGNKVHGRTICYDLHSTFGYDDNLDYVPNNKGKFNEIFPQVNMGICYSVEALELGLPLFPYIYQGVPNNFDIYDRLAQEAKRNLLNHIEIITDGEIDLEDAFNSSIDPLYDFTIVEPTYKGNSLEEEIEKYNIQKKETTEKQVSYIESTDGTITDAIAITQTKYEFNDREYRLIKYKSYTTREPLTDLFENTIYDAEEKLKQNKTLSNSSKKQYEYFFDIEENEDQTFSFTRNQDHFIKELEKIGTFTILTSNLEDHPIALFMRTWHKKEIEKILNSIKNDFTENKLNGAEYEVARGKSILSFIGLILRQSIINKIKKAQQSKKFKQSISEDLAITMLSDLHCVRKNDRWIINEDLTVAQKKLIKLLGLPIVLPDES